MFIYLHLFVYLFIYLIHIYIDIDVDKSTYIYIYVYIYICYICTHRFLDHTTLVFPPNFGSQDYLDFMADFIEQKREEVEHLDAGDIDFSSEPGLGAEGCNGGHGRVLWDQR